MMYNITVKIIDKPLAKIESRSLTATRPFWTDWSLWTLVVANAWTIVLAVVQKWSLADILWTFWFQSVTIGVFAFFRILTFKNFSDRTFDINGQPHLLTLYGRTQIAGWFILIYGFIHIVFAISLSGLHNQKPGINVFLVKWPVLIAAAIFFANHLFSFIYNRKWDSALKIDTGDILVFPILRIIPMFLTFLIGLPLSLAIVGELHPKFNPDTMGIHFKMSYEPIAHSTFIIIFFMLIKTYLDAVMHIKESKKFGSRSN